MIDNPRSWSDVLRCECQACLALKAIYLRCVERAAFLFVSDCRMFGRGFQVVDVQRVFSAIAAIGPDYPTAAAAGRYVLARQQHCDAFVSSWPLKPAGKADYLWKREQLA